MLVRSQICAARDGESKDGQYRRAPVKVESGKSLAAPAVAVALRVEHGVMPFPSVCVSIAALGTAKRSSKGRQHHQQQQEMGQISGGHGVKSRLGSPGN